jgi:hypothetical protein
MRNGSRFQHYLAVKNEIFSSADRVFCKNAQIVSPVRFALTLCLIRFDLFTFFAEKRRNLGKKYGKPRAK